MSRISRRALARYAVDEMMNGASAKTLARQLAAALADSGRTGEVEFLMGDIAWELESRGELTVAKVTSATPLTGELMNELSRQLKSATKSKAVSVEEIIDKSVIGGVRIETSNRVWDATVSRKLSRIREAF